MGLGLLMAPRHSGRLWMGRHNRTPAAIAAARWLGIRDLALGLTLARTIDHSANRRQLFIEAAAIDITDAAVSYVERGRLPGSWWPLITGGASLMAIFDAAFAVRA